MNIVINILFQMWEVLGEMSVYLLFGFLIAGILSVFISPETVERHLGGKGILPVVKSTFFGIPLPLCSCGVIPVATSLRRHGATRGATAAFLMSTPQTGIDSILVTYSLLGIVFAVFRPIAALVTGVVGGLFIDLFDQKKDLDELAVNVRCEDICCSIEGPQKHGKLYRIFRHGFVTLPADIAIHLLVGLLIAGLIAALLPPGFFAETFLGHGILAMLTMLVIGIPTYICAAASVPMALALIATGVSPGAVLVFLIAAPASNAATLATIWKIMGKKTTVIYLLSVSLTALAAGFVLEYIFALRGLPLAEQIQPEELLPDYLKTLSAIALLAILIAPIVYNYWGKRKPLPLDKGLKQNILNVAGMQCAECAEMIREGLLTCEGVADVRVDRHADQVNVIGQNPDMECARRVVRQLGFTLKENNHQH